MSKKTIFGEKIFNAIIEKIEDLEKIIIKTFHAYNRHEQKFLNYYTDYDQLDSFKFTLVHPHEHYIIKKFIELERYIAELKIRYIDRENMIISFKIFEDLNNVFNVIDL